MSASATIRDPIPARTLTRAAVAVVVSVLFSIAVLICYAVLAVLFNLGAFGIEVTTGIIKMLCLTVILTYLAAGRLLWSREARLALTERN
ncbi:hypothetical protein M446_2461 [Methylobacterium sp. 4-46]|uniref:hypothetical protein n=1 Tax=unclassified Methylobacterium TaxID=2615210 RepID=UPI000152DAB3|nr:MULTISPECIES: hypothetical protein [Methylobacterium]ACA16914.1 hypothetical protein M446_2461 [Methylobacterium sp. 4-46]WFT82602.1 hypothetical protein QA634_12460 [Methylobacterium nodulans]